MGNLILDDVRDAIQVAHCVNNPNMYINADWDIVKSYDEFVEYILKNGLPNIISYDHDLADEHYANGASHVDEQGKHFSGFNYNKVTEKTGYHAVLWMIEHCIENEVKMPESYAHSMNPYGRMKIQSAIDQYNRMYESGELDIKAD